MVDACDGSNEGQNEMVRLIIGPNPITIANFSVPTYITGRVNWNSGSNPWRGLTNWTTTTKAKITYLNKSIKSAGNCGLLIPLNSTDKAPANSQLLIITSESWNELAQSFDGLNDTLYVAVQKSGNTAGHFANFGAAATRTFILRNGTNADTVIYHIDSLRKQNGTLGAEDGATVNFTPNGKATYTNYGCKIPVDPSSIDAGTVAVNGCATSTIQLNGKIINYPCFKWVAANPASGTFSDTLSATSKFYPTTTGKITLYLKGFKPCGGSAIDSVSFTLGSSTKANFDIDSSQAPLFCFTDKSSNATQLQWSFNSKNNIKTSFPKTFGQDTAYAKGNVCKDYVTSGSRFVCLIATNQNDPKCNDTFCVKINHDFYIYLANVFTPGAKDGYNDEFRVPSAGLKEFDISIMNRWGELIFQTNKPNTNWNGQVNNDGPECPAGTYFYQMHYQ
ncbi:MAG: gliding motility-associated C-terminal domain-containing protein, partial [Bacteroidetes bacterium]|nr:gliding motility-associated C-terminal domain-containing protein [Bacteroidota bacterium]